MDEKKLKENLETLRILNKNYLTMIDQGKLAEAKEAMQKIIDLEGGDE